MRRFFSYLILCIAAVKSFACTGIVMHAKDHSSVSGRTVEFGMPLDMSLAVIPRNHAFTGTTPVGPGMSYRSKYAAVGVYCFDDPILMDGMNEKGLVAAAFYFPGYASYSQVTKENRLQALSPVDFTNWLLTQFASVEEVKEALSSIKIVPTVFSNWGSVPPPFHYVVYDAAGKSIVIEPVNRTLKVHDNPIGVMTNSPTFDWHLTNLSNYINLSPFNVDRQTLRNFVLHSFGQGTGMLGLPGDFTPPSRFVRAAFFSAKALLSENANQAVDQTFHLLNQFDIPRGIARQKEPKNISYDYTMLTTVKNPKSLDYFYRSYEDQAIRYLSLREFDLNARKIKKMNITGKQKTEDVSSFLK